MRDTMKGKKQKTYWAGLNEKGLIAEDACEIAYNWDQYGQKILTRKTRMPRLFTTKFEALREFSNVRKVKIVEVKNGR